MTTPLCTKYYHTLKSAVAISIVGGLMVVACSSAPERSPGEMAFRANCRTCHVLPRPEKYSDEQWPALVKRYGARAKLTEPQIALITEYLLKVNNRE